jgi:hypothetical protein
MFLAPAIEGAENEGAPEGHMIFRDAGANCIVTLVEPEGSAIDHLVE